MAKITISDLPAPDTESYLQQLTDEDYKLVHGGSGNDFSNFLQLGIKVLQFALIGYAINSIVSLVESFMAPFGGQSSSNQLSSRYSQRFRTRG